MSNIDENNSIEYRIPYPTQMKDVSLKVLLALVKDKSNNSPLVEILARETPYFIILASHIVQLLKITREIIPDLLLLEDGVDGMHSLPLYNHIASIYKAPVPAILYVHDMPKKRQWLENKKVLCLNSASGEGDVLEALKTLL